MRTLFDPPSDPAQPSAELVYHPAAALFPLLPVDSQEFGELVEDIREHGLIQPIVLHDGTILDGRNRYRACQHAGVQPRFVEWDGESPTAYVLSLNLHRRHLTEDQKAAVVQEARARLEAEARDHQRAAGRQFGRGATGKLVADSPQAIDTTMPAHKDAGAPRGSRRAPTTRKRLAELADVSEHKIRQAERVLAGAPDLVDQVIAGTMPLREAERHVEARQAESKLDEAIPIYRWLFGDEALFVAGTEMRVEAGRRMVDNQDPIPVRVPHPETGEMVLVSREEILEHADADRRVLDADVRYADAQARWHRRLISALRPYGDRSTPVGEAVRRAAQDLGIERNGRSFEEFAGLVVAAAEARDGARPG